MTLGYPLYPTWKWNEYIVHHVLVWCIGIVFLFSPEYYHWYVAMASLSCLNEGCLLLRTVVNDTRLHLRLGQYMAAMFFNVLVYPTWMYIAYIDEHRTCMFTCCWLLFGVYGLLYYVSGTVRDVKKWKTIYRML